MSEAVESADSPDSKFGHNRLPELIAQIKTAHTETIALARRTLDSAIRAGKLLIEAKALVAHGQWLPLLKEAGISIQIAQRYMRLAHIPPDKYVTVTHLGIRAALDKIAQHAEEGDEEAELAAVRARVAVEEAAQRAAEAAQREEVERQRRQREEVRQAAEAMREKIEAEARQRAKERQERREWEARSRAEFAQMFNERQREKQATAAERVKAAPEFAKILGLLGSEHDGEVLNAASQAERLRKKVQAQWSDLICVSNCPLRRGTVH
jgi:hypothetical protein